MRVGVHTTVRDCKYGVDIGKEMSVLYIENV